jgi:myo-inositol-1(or 4)-monophosphatase
VSADLELALTLAKKAGEVIRANFLSTKNAKTKSSDVDPVTETDIACEKIIIDSIKEAYPSHKFVAEESYSGDFQVDDSPTWFIDPVDGT